MGKRIVNQVVNTIVDKETGEVLSEVIETSSRAKNEVGFTMLYDECWLKVTTLSSSASIIFNEMVKMMNKKTHVVVFSAFVRNELKKKVDCSGRMFEKSLRDLKDKELLFPYVNREKCKIERGVLIVSPFAIGRSSVANNKKLRIGILSDKKFIAEHHLLKAVEQAKAEDDENDD